MAVTISTSDLKTIYYTSTSTPDYPWWMDDVKPSWEELWPEQKIKSKESKCSVQEPPRKKDIRFLNRST